MCPFMLKAFYAILKTAPISVISSSSWPLKRRRHCARLIKGCQNDFCLSGQNFTSISQCRGDILQQLKYKSYMVRAQSCTAQVTLAVRDVKGISKLLPIRYKLHVPKMTSRTKQSVCTLQLILYG